jgi:hypothetical protein
MNFNCNSPTNFRDAQTTSGEGPPAFAFYLFPGTAWKAEASNNKGTRMKDRIITGWCAMAAGLLIALGPRFLFPLCGPLDKGNWMKCHWTGQAELGAGFLLAALGVGMLLSASAEIRAGLNLAAALTGALALALPHLFIGGCANAAMPCRAVSFPSLTVISILTVAGFACNAGRLRVRKRGDLPRP